MCSKRNDYIRIIILVFVFSSLYIHGSHATGMPWVDKNGFLTAFPEEPQVEERECHPCKIPTLRSTGNYEKLLQNSETVVCFGAKSDSQKNLRNNRVSDGQEPNSRSVNTADETSIIDEFTPNTTICESELNETEPHIQRLTKFTFSTHKQLHIAVLSLKKYVMGEWEKIDETFSNLPNLTHLYLENNHITSLNSSGNSANLTKLAVLSLAHNPITYLTANSFSWLEGSNLTYLNLRGCLALKWIDHEAFLPLSDHALSLDLSQSALTAEPLENILVAFNGSDVDNGLQALGLSQMGISQIPLRALKHVNHSLKTLSMQGNRLSDWQTTQRSCLSFPQLKQLNLRNNDFSRYPGCVFNNTPKLEELILDGNPLTELDCESLQSLSALSLKYICSSFSWNACSLPFLKSIDFSNSLLNPSQLNFSFFQNSLLETLILRNSSIENITPLGLSNLQNLKHLDLRNNNKLGKNMATTSFRGSQKLRYISLRMCGIRGNLPANLFDSLTELEELDMSFNSITTLNSSMFSNIKSLTKLNLGDNHITSLPPQIFQNTRVLYMNLENNWFTEVSEAIIKVLQDLDVDPVEVNLSNNPFICQCLSQDFLQLFDEKKAKIKLLYTEEESAYECTTRNNSQLSIQRLKQIREHFKTDDGHYCPEPREITTISTTTTTATTTDGVGTTTKTSGTALEDEENDGNPSVLKYILIGFSVIFLLLLLSVSCYSKWWNIRLFAYLVKRTVVLSILKDEREIKYKRTASYQYDVFVSFSDSNRMWILEELIPNLEHQCNIKVCLHERDFQAGLPILDNIISCMDRSRCILLVLSEAFLQSHWCQFELNLAQHRLLEMRRDQLLLVLLENIPRDKCSKMLRYLLLTKTYIQWPRQGGNEEKKAFWRKMKKALGPPLDNTNASNV